MDCTGVLGVQSSRGEGSYFLAIYLGQSLIAGWIRVCGTQKYSGVGPIVTNIGRETPQENHFFRRFHGDIGVDAF